MAGNRRVEGKCTSAVDRAKVLSRDANVTYTRGEVDRVGGVAFKPTADTIGRDNVGLVVNSFVFEASV